LAATVVAFACALSAAAPRPASAASAFREVAVVSGALYVRSDGERFAWATNAWGAEHGVVRVFDTLRGRNFRLTAPEPGCGFDSVGGGLAVWSCFPPETKLLTNLSTGRSRKPAGIGPIERIAAEPGFFCRTHSIGRYWLEYSCGTGFGPGDDTYWLNHRTGRITGGVELEDKLFSPDAPFVDLDYAGLFRPYCAPLDRPSDGSHAPPYFDYAPPYALHAPLGPGALGVLGTGTRFDSIRLRRCGIRRAETLSQCRFTDCRTPQLGSGYVTWGEHKRVYAYLPSIRRRVLVGRAPAGFLRGRKLSVAHTCNRIFALWGYGIYAARFEPRHGAPTCQATLKPGR
jgi:hypothetical protein